MQFTNNAGSLQWNRITSDSGVLTLDSTTSVVNGNLSIGNGSSARGKLHVRSDAANAMGPTVLITNAAGGTGAQSQIAFEVDASADAIYNARIICINRDSSNQSSTLLFNHYNGSSDFEALKISSAWGGSQGSTTSGVGFGNAGVFIDRGWANYPGIMLARTSASGGDNLTYNEFRFHGDQPTWSSYPASGGGDFSVNLRIDGATYFSSDERRKTNIEPIEDALNSVLSLNGVQFNTINSDGEIEQTKTIGGKLYGFIAQQVQPHVPNAVIYYPEEDIAEPSGYANAYSVDYSSIVAVLVEAVKQLNQKVEDLTNQINNQG